MRLDLLLPPGLVLFGGRRVVTMAVDNHGVTTLAGMALVRNVAKDADAVELSRPAEARGGELLWAKMLQECHTRGQYAFVPSPFEKVDEAHLAYAVN